MLALTRKTGEMIQIGDDIIVKVIRIRSGRAVSIGIDAPADVRVKRIPELPRKAKVKS